MITRVQIRAARALVGWSQMDLCPYQKLRPTVWVVQATENTHWNDPPDPVDRSMDWGVFVQRQVSPSFVVIRDVAGDDAAEVSLAEHDEMVETLPPDRGDQPFGVTVLS